MGCYMPKNIPNRPIEQKTFSEKHIDHIELESNLDIKPRLQLTNRACGYLFDIEASLSKKLIDPNQQNLIKQLLKQYKKCQHCYHQHNIDQAIEHKTNLYKLLHQINNYKQHPSFLEIIGESQKLQLEEIQKFMTLIEEEYNEIILYEQQVLKGGWIQKSNSKGVKVSIRTENQTVSSLIESEISTPFETLLAVLVEIDFYKDIIPFVKISSMEKQVSRNCRIGYAQSRIPFLSVREAFFQGIGYNRLPKNGQLFILTRSIHNRKDLQEKLQYECKSNKDYIELQFKYIILKYKPIGNGKGKLMIAMNVNPKLDFLPMWILEKICVQFGQDFFKNILSISKKFKGSKWQEKVKQNPYLFDFFKGVIDQYVTQQNL